MSSSFSSEFVHVTSEGLGVDIHPFDGLVGLRIDGQDYVDLVSTVCLRPIKFNQDINTFIFLFSVNLTLALTFLIQLGLEH